MNLIKPLQVERRKLAARVEALDRAIDALEALDGGRKPAKLGRPVGSVTKKRHMSAKARKAIGAAKKAWWAAKKRAGK